ncbi:MAG: hypothetical protein V4608_06105 [Bacteroidota bacterium]
MPRLRIYKTKSFFAGPKNVILFIDNQEIGDLKHEDRIEPDISFGSHKIQVQSKFFSSTIQDFRMDVKKEIEISVKFGNLFKAAQIVFSIALSISIFFESKVFFYISDLLFLTFFSMLIIKRKDFFIIKELN